MLPSSGIILILLPTSLWWTRSNGYINNTSTTDMTPSTHQGTSQQLTLNGTKGITPSTTSHVTPSMTNKNETTTSPVIENNTKSNSVPHRSTNGTLLPLSWYVTNSLPDAINNSTTNRIPASSTISITTSDFPTVTASNLPTSAGIPRNTELKNITSVNYTSSTATIFTKGTLTNSTEVSSTNSPSNTLTTFSTANSDNVTTDFKTISKTTNVHQNFTNHSTFPSNPKEPNEENQHSAGVVFGAIVGAILGSALIGLIGYFLCTKRKPDSFSHQRLYDDPRSEPVLRLENSSYDVSLGDLSYYNPSTTESAAQNSKGKPYDGIPMGNLTSSQPPA
uniref:Mucin 15, cell surface associated n=1 Tax=Pelodiscus sinensis TaxID=13735 RepID=K7F845_PELSI|nr:mucin-15 [Pelodiscus sinensis]|eukprot:XP_006111561.1 mucin-15 [Pelodiscus sinensis]